MNGIFISYRREDSEGFARSLFQSLTAHFGTEQIFMDVEDIELGLDFVEAIDKSLSSCDVLLVMMGKEWLTCVNSEGVRRLDDPEDFVRIEVATALRRNVRVIPVLVRGGAMPKTEDLPEDLKLLTRRQALELRHDRWNSDIERLQLALEKMVGAPPKAEPEPETAKAAAEQPPETVKPEKTKAGKHKGKTLLILGVAAAFALVSIGLRLFQTSEPISPGQQVELHEASPVVVAEPEPRERRRPREVIVEEPAPIREPEPPRRPAPPRDMIMMVQELLTELGYRPGPVDGQLGAQTTRAIRAFQRDKGMESDGEITEGLVEVLTEAMVMRQELPAAGYEDRAPVGAVNMSGTWYDNQGLLYYVTVQSGNIVRQEAYFTLGGVFAGRVEGILNGRTLNYQYGALDGSRGEGRGVVSEDGRHMEYAVTNLVTGMQEAGVLHKEHLPH